MTTQDFSQFGPSAEKIFRHWHLQAQVESPEQVLDRFRKLFIDGTSYPDTVIRAALTQIVNDPVMVQEFPLILNRCCYILINHWKTNRAHQSWAVKELVSLLGQSAATPTRSRSTLQLRKLVKTFIATPDYQILQAAARDIRDPVSLRLKTELNEASGAETEEPLILTLDRCPFLYKHLSDQVQIPQERLSIDPSMQLKRFHQDLDQYFQQWQQLDGSTAEPLKIGAGRGQAQGQTQRLAQSSSGQLHPAKPSRSANLVLNPTVLSDRDLNSSLHYFTGPIEGTASYADLAQQFLHQADATPNFRRFKEDLCDYLIAAIDPGYGKHNFNRRLQERLRNVMRESDRQPPSEFLRHTTYRELFYFLVVDTNTQAPHYEVFLDLLNNLGYLKTTGLLLRIALLWGQAHVFLERRFAVLFRHHCNALCSQVEWLVKALGVWSVARWLHFDRRKLLLPM